MKDIKEFLYKPVLYDDGNSSPILMLIYNVNKSHDMFKGFLDENLKTRSTTISLVNISASLESQTVVREKIEINKELIEALHQIDLEDYTKTLGQFSLVCFEESQLLQEDLSELGKITNALASNLGKPFVKSEDQDNIINFSVKDMFGKKTPLNAKEIEKIYPIVINIVKENLDINVEDSTQVDGLKKKIEFAIIEYLPGSVVLEDMNINMECICSIISKFNNRKDEENG